MYYTTNLTALLFRRVREIKPDEEPYHQHGAVFEAVSLTSVPLVALGAALPDPASHPSI
jgi:hypothetical protein